MGIQILWTFCLINYSLIIKSVTALNWSQQLSCGDKWKIVTWTDRCFQNKKNNFDKICIMNL